MLGTGSLVVQRCDGGVAALRVDTCFSVMDLGSCSCELIGATVDGYFIVHAMVHLSQRAIKRGRPESW